MSVTNQKVNIKELKENVIILEKKLNDIGYNYFLLTNDEFELDIEFIKTFFKNNCNNCNDSAKWIVFIILLLKKKIKYYENINKKKKYYFIIKVITIIMLVIIHILLFVQFAYNETLQSNFYGYLEYPNEIEIFNGIELDYFLTL
jgi:hypothetical protein